MQMLRFALDRTVRGFAQDDNWLIFPHLHPVACAARSLYLDPTASDRTDAGYVGTHAERNRPIATFRINALRGTDLPTKVPASTIYGDLRTETGD
jgi:hypothetical protein